MKEKNLQNDFIKFLLDHGVYYVKTVVCSRAGVPDVIACIDGMFYAFELKGDGGKESALQKYNGEKITGCGGKYFVVTPQNYSKITDLITWILTI